MISNTDSSSNTSPVFKSTLPPELLDGLDKRGQYLYTSIDNINQAQAFLMERVMEHSKILTDLRTETAEIKAQTTKTNGRVTTLENDAGLKLARVGNTLIRNKYFWFVLACAVLIGIPSLTHYGSALFPLLKNVFLG